MKSSSDCFRKVERVVSSVESDDESDDGERRRSGGLDVIGGGELMQTESVEPMALLEFVEEDT